MKKLFITIIIIIILIFAYNQYKSYQRFHPKNSNYKVSESLDLEHYNQDLVYRYFEAVESLNGFVTMQWSANEIDVRSPEDDDQATKFVLEQYNKKLAKVKLYEVKLEASKKLKNKGLTNNEIEFLIESKKTQEELTKEAKFKKIKSMFNPTGLRIGETSAFVYEVQKLLVKKGYNIPVDGVYKKITKDAIFQFENKNNLFADGNMDVLTLEALFN